MTIQQQMKTKLEQVGIPYKEVECYGSQIVITCWSLNAAEKWGALLSRFATVKRVGLRSFDYAKENKGTCLLPSRVDVWRTYATI